MDLVKSYPHQKFLNINVYSPEIWNEIWNEKGQKTKIFCLALQNQYKNKKMTKIAVTQNVPIHPQDKQ